MRGGEKSVTGILSYRNWQRRAWCRGGNDCLSDPKSVLGCLFKRLRIKRNQIRWSNIVVPLVAELFLCCTL